MATLPLVVNAASTPTLNHYSDYGVVEQNQSVTSGGINITNDPFGYSDQYTDSESGLQYLQVRYYDPLVMRFTQMDTYPLLNRYAYANENPIMDDDPSGHNAVGASLSSGGVGGWAGSLAGGGAGLVFGLVGGALASVFTEGVSMYAALAVESAVGATASTGGQLVQDGVDHKSVNGLQLGVAAAGGAVISAIGFGIGKYSADLFKPAAASTVVSTGGDAASDDVSTLLPSPDRAEYDKDNFDSPITLTSANGKTQSYTPWKAFREWEKYLIPANGGNVVVNQAAIDVGLQKQAAQTLSALEGAEAEGMDSDYIQILKDTGDKIIAAQQSTLKNEEIWRVYLSFRSDFLDNAGLDSSKVYISSDGKMDPELSRALGLQ